jgi:hypothetical protein
MKQRKAWKCLQDKLFYARKTLSKFFQPFMRSNFQNAITAVANKKRIYARHDLVGQMTRRGNRDRHEIIHIDPLALQRFLCVIRHEHAIQIRAYR